MVGNHCSRTVDDQLVEADISSFYVSVEGRRFFEQYWDAIDHLLDSEDQKKCSIRDVLSPLRSQVDRLRCAYVIPLSIARLFWRITWVCLLRLLT